jgi:hypothetical protein
VSSISPPHPRRAGLPRAVRPAGYYRQSRARPGLRAVFIAPGAVLLSLLSFMFLLSGLLLIWTAVRLYRHRDEDPDVGTNPLVRAARRVLPVSDAYAGGAARLDSRPCS